MCVLDYIRMIPSQNLIWGCEWLGWVLDYIRMIPSQNTGSSPTKD